MKKPYAFLSVMEEDVHIPADPMKEEPIDIHPDVTPDVTPRTGDIVDQNEIVSGIESLHIPFYGEYLKEIQTSSSTTQTDQNVQKLAMFSSVKPMNNIPSIRTSDKIHFRVFLKAQQEFTEEYITRLCRFLDSRTPEQTVTFYLGNSLSNRYTMIIGSILSAIHSCPAKTIGIAAGCCGVPETMMWCFCNERQIAEYGALTFGGTDLIRHFQFYKYYLDVCFDRAIAIGIINRELVDTIWKDGKEVLLTYVDCQKI